MKTLGLSDVPAAKVDGATTLRDRVRIVERRELWLWGCAVLITLLLTGGIVSFGFPTLHVYHAETESAPLNDTILGLVGMVLLFDMYTVYQHLQIKAVRQQLLEREELFRLITENAADMIAVVDTSGERVYTSPSYEKILGYKSEELKDSTAGRKSIQRTGPSLKSGGRCPAYRHRHERGISHAPQRWKLAHAGIAGKHHHEGRKD